MTEIAELKKCIERLEKQHEYNPFTFSQIIMFIVATVCSVATIGIAIFVGTFIAAFFRGTIDSLLDQWGTIFLVCLCIAVPFWIAMSYLFYRAIKEEKHVKGCC